MVVTHRQTDYLKTPIRSWVILAYQSFRPEFGLIVMWSKRPNAKLFKRFVVEVALPFFRGRACVDGSRRAAVFGWAQLRAKRARIGRVQIFKNVSRRILLLTADTFS